MASPTLAGSMDLSRGEFTFLGETFPLNSGQVLFTGGGEIDPELSVVAARTTADITARVEVGGRASSPTIRLTSEPVLPEDEVLARILFGKSAGQLERFQFNRFIACCLEEIEAFFVGKEIADVANGLP